MASRRGSRVSGHGAAAPSVRCNLLNRREIRLGDAIVPAKLIFVPEGPNKTQKASSRGDQISEASPNHLARNGYAAVKSDHTQSAKHHARRRAAENRE